jgi:hypothetical protein
MNTARNFVQLIKEEHNLELEFEDEIITSAAGFETSINLKPRERRRRQV